MAEVIRVRGFTRKGGIKVRPHTKRKPVLSPEERARRAERARRVLLPAALKATARKGFYETLAGLERHRDKVTDPTRLAGWLRTRPEVVRVRGVPSRKGARKISRALRGRKLTLEHRRAISRGLRRRR
ncbi:MAG: hypothetical protein QW561_00500 [Candidatus Aenigmatarchaeota archaeon]